MWLYCPSLASALAEPVSIQESNSRWRVRMFARSCTWRGKFRPVSTWRRRWRRVDWLRRRSGALSSAFQTQASKTFESSLKSLLSDSRRGSLVSLSPGLEKEKGSTTRDGYGPRSIAGFLWFDPECSSWKTFQASLFEDFHTSPPPWPKRGTLRNGTCFELPKRALPTSASGSSWWQFYPTPTASSYGSSQNEGTVPHDRPSRGTPSLETWARRWPTPLASDASGGGSFKRGNLTLTGAAQQWPTPTATDARGSRRSTAATAEWKSNPGTTLTDAALLFPVSTHQDPTTPQPGPTSSATDDSSTSPPESPQKLLNPLFVFWLMGWAPWAGWLCYDSPETESCPNRQPLPIDRSSKVSAPERCENDF